MKTYKEVEVKERSLETITCDKCGKIYSTDNHSQDVFEVQEFHSISRRGGYGSVFGDEDLFELDLCQHCFKEMLEGFGIDIKKHTKEG